MSQRFCAEDDYTSSYNERRIGEMLSSQLAKERLERQKCLLKLLSNARFLSRQGLAFRGDGEELDSNFMRLIYLRSEDNTKLVDWMKQKTDKYTSADIQNEMVKVMALRVLRKIAGSLQSAPYFTVMVDEITDVSNVEQVVICIRWVSEKFEVQEELVGLYKVPSTGAEIIYAAITDVMCYILRLFQRCAASATMALLPCPVRNLEWRRACTPLNPELFLPTTTGTR